MGRRKKKEIRIRIHGMAGTQRRVYAHGHMRTVTVHYQNKDETWYCSMQSASFHYPKIFNIPSSLFYHKAGDRWICRNSIEFMEVWPDHPLNIEIISP